ncbi:GWxTD domain-containing protein [Ekhidna sp.]|uniref:GWxTD domain-containing protein n=1 Tax=Ekhidna sp. TaxID=2608089 RepID=UPI0032EB8C06
MRKHVLILSVFVIFCGFSASAVNFSRVNVAWQYDLDFSVKMSHRVVKEGGGFFVLLSVSSDSVVSWEYELLVQDGYESETHRTIQPQVIDTLLNVGGQVMVRLLFNQIEENLLVVKFSKPESFYYYDIPLKIGSLSYPSIYPVDERGMPILEKFINRSGSSWRGSDTLLAMQYAEKFPPADPPMADMKPLAPQVNLDTSFVFVAKSDFIENHFYVVRKDSLASVGVTMLRVPPYFPEYRQLGELIESMLYLTSEQEKKAMLKSRNPKESFDSFWMNTYSTKARARGAIRRYYNWIEETNKLFTDFKPGWKTDRGMMYIVFGRPNEVYRTGNSEEWFYDEGPAFEFTIISTFFAPKTYSLRRSKDLEEQWYTQIAAIRRGIR